MFLEGSKDDKIKQNLWAALSLLDEIENTVDKNQLDVSELIKQVAEQVFQQKS